jgi:hypothetical protein
MSRPDPGCAARRNASAQARQVPATSRHALLTVRLPVRLRAANPSSPSSRSHRAEQAVETVRQTDASVPVKLS